MAKTLFEQAVALGDVATVHSNLGVVYGWQGNYELAVAAHKQALCPNPNLARAHG